MTYHFDVDHAKKYGVDGAILLQNIIFWCRQNKANGLHRRDGRTWTYNSAPAYEKLFPFWKARTINRILNALVRQGAIVKGTYNLASYDRTGWYAVADESLLDLDVSPATKEKVCHQSKLTDRSDGIDRPIPDGNPDENLGEPKTPSNPTGQNAGREPPAGTAPLIAALRSEAREAGIPGTFARSERFRAGIRDLIADGVKPERIKAAFKTAIVHAKPGKLAFFPEDFAQYRPKTSPAPSAPRPRCAECGNPVFGDTAPDGRSICPRCADRLSPPPPELVAELAAKRAAFAARRSA